MSDRHRKHDWILLGGAGGWEVWMCTRCRRSTIPTVFGFLLPDLLRWFVPSMRCRSGVD